MSRDRWQQIKDIFHSALERTPAARADFLKEVCGDDAAMREDVEALLLADADNEHFLSSPAYEFAAGMLASEESEFSVGQKVGRYEILSALGSGGMGQIYLAYDAQLGRKIALKLISPEFATDPRRVHRFEQEARAASSLNHPNVCVIHEIGTTDNGRHFIAMEYIDGITLRDQLASGPLKPLEALQVTIQVGTALASAHAVGIVHRDIKPENIMLRPDGYVKVVDFGLAKLIESLPEQQHLHNALTESRTLMGTVKYMSPEQLREVAVDERTDIWSLGIVLYEMLTGVTPFEARSYNDSIALILSPSPSVSLFPDLVPIQLRKVVEKALEKDSDQRYQSVTSLISDLSNLKRELERDTQDSLITDPGIQSSPVWYAPEDYQGATPRSYFGSTVSTGLHTILTAGSRSSEIIKSVAVAVGLLTLLFFLPWTSRWLFGLVNRIRPVSQTSGNAPGPPMKTLTSAGASVCAAISPDGKLVAHAEEQEGKQHLAIINTTTSRSSVVVPPEDVRYLGISFSPDSKYVYFTRKEKNGDGILYRLAVTGANLTKLNNDVDGPISFSPKGDRFAFVRDDDEVSGEFFLMLSDIDGTHEQVVAYRKDRDTFSVNGPAWSPDGSMIVCPAGHWDNSFNMNLIGFDLKTGLQQSIGSQSWFSIFGVAWQADMTSLVISAREQATSPFQLWRIRLSDGTAKKITYDLAEYTGVSLSGDKILTTQINHSWWIWVSTLGDPQKATAIASGAGPNYGLSWTSKGKIVYSSIAQNRVNIFRIDPDGSNSVQLTNDAGDNYTPVASADGRFIVFASNRNGRFNIWRMNANDGSDPKQLTFSDANFYPSCSPDNQWVAYENKFNSIFSVWKVPLTGDGETIKVAEGYRMPVFSPNNKFIAARYELSSGSHNMTIFPTEGTGGLRNFSIPIQDWQQVQWFASSNELSFLRNIGGYVNIWSYALDKYESKQLTKFDVDLIYYANVDVYANIGSYIDKHQSERLTRVYLIYAYAWSPDYKQVAYQLGTKLRNVTMISEQ
jgi:serine/threonine protein kinase